MQLVCLSVCVQIQERVVTVLRACEHAPRTRVVKVLRACEGTPCPHMAASLFDL